MKSFYATKIKPFIICFLLMLTSFNCISQLEIKFDDERGFYSVPFTLKIHNDTPNTSLKYTTDGSAPITSASATFFNSNTLEINITKTTVVRVFATNGTDSLKLAHSYIFLNDVLQQNNNNVINSLHYPPVWATGMVSNLPITQNADYEMDTSVLNNPSYALKLLDGLKQIPTISISTHKDNLFNQNSGIYSNPLEDSRDWEIPASIEMFTTDTTDLINNFQIEAGLKISGASTRKLEFYKHSFRIKFRSEYGHGKLKHPVFGAEGADEFDNLQLRMIGHCSPNDPSSSGRQSTQFHKDEWARNLHREMGNLSPRSKFVHLYLNGIYWGMYDLTERPDANFLASYLGGNELDYDAIKILETKDGDSLAYYEMFDIAYTNFHDTVPGANGFPLPVLNEQKANLMYEDIKNYLDIESFIDYFLLNTFLVNSDWGANNWWAGRKREPGAGYKFFVWDAEFILNDSPVYTSKVFSADARYHPNGLEKRLRFVKEFKRKFGDRVQCNCYETDGPLYIDNLIDSYIDLESTISKASLLELARWGDTRGELIDYNGHVLNEMTQYVNETMPELLGEIMRFYTYASVNYYPRGLSAVKLSHLGGEVQNGLQLSLTNPNNEGEIYYTTDGSDPMSPNNPYSIKYTQPITINGYSKISARVLVENYVYGPSYNRDTIFNHWSAMCPREFYTTGYYNNIVVNEIHYNPPDIGGTNGGLHEFIELKNIGTTQVNLCNAYFESGINYTFPANSILLPDDFIVLARDSIEFHSMFNFWPDGAYGGKLSNGGEHIQFNKPNKQLIDDVEYDDSFPWDAHPDGSGQSLSLDLKEVQNPVVDNNEPTSWRSSVGTPTPRDENIFCLPITTNEFIAKPSCLGHSDGFISVSVSGAGAPFTYSWNTGEATNAISNISSGTYTLTITDSQNCPKKEDIIVNDPPPLISNLAIQPASSAGSYDGSATVSMGQSASSYTINWSNGATGSTINNLQPGIYTVTVDNNQGCSQDKSFTVGVGPLCEVPSNIVASAAGNNSIILSWDSDVLSTTCLVEWRKTGDSNWITRTTSNPYIALAGLLGCTNYEYRVSSQCSGGTSSSLSTQNSVSTNCTQNNTCNASTTNGYSHNSTPTSAFLVWDISPNSTYKLHYKKSSDTNFHIFDSNYHFAILFNLDNCSTYNWYVDIICPSGQITSTSTNTFQTTNCRLASKNDLNIEIYPNPATELLNIQIQNEIDINNSFVSIFDFSGKKIKGSQVKAHNFQIDINLLPKGVYFVKFENNSLVKTKKINIF